LGAESVSVAANWAAEDVARSRAASGPGHLDDAGGDPPDVSRLVEHLMQSGGEVGKDLLARERLGNVRGAQS
jgi:hypothetical protein